jgi:hypothetical protein
MKLQELAEKGRRAQIPSKDPLREDEGCMGHIVVRDGKGKKDRVTVLPKSIAEPLRAVVEEAKRIHKQDLQDDHDLYPCHESSRTRCSKPAGYALIVAAIRSHTWASITTWGENRVLRHNG